MTDARMILTCGLPGAGKTTLATRLAEQRDAAAELALFDPPPILS